MKQLFLLWFVGVLSAQLGTNLLGNLFAKVFTVFFARLLAHFQHKARAVVTNVNRVCGAVLVLPSELSLLQLCLCSGSACLCERGALSSVRLRTGGRTHCQHKSQHEN